MGKRNERDSRWSYLSFVNWICLVIRDTLYVRVLSCGGHRKFGKVAPSCILGKAVDFKLLLPPAARDGVGKVRISVWILDRYVSTVDDGHVVMDCDLRSVHDRFSWRQNRAQ